MTEIDKVFEVSKLIGKITDEDSFVEMLTHVRGKSSMGEARGEGIISGFATINDIQTGIFATNHEVLMGSIGKKSAKKISRVVENAIKTGSPVVGIIDSEGARFAEGIKAMEGYGDIIHSLNLAYGVVPVILIIKGSCYGMLSYLAAGCDCCIALDNARIATSSPLILAAKNNADTAAVATRKAHIASGLITNAVSEAELKKTVGDLLTMLVGEYRDNGDDGNRVCPELTAGANARDVILSAFDKDSFIETRAGFGEEAITGFARLNGLPVGVVANNSAKDEGRLSSDGAYKIASLVNTCDNFGLPVVSLVDCMGVVCDLKQENSSLIRNIGEMLYAYNVSNVCKVSMIIGNAVGLGYVAFAGKHQIDYTIAWESANIGVLDNEATATLLFGDMIKEAENKDVLTEELAEAYGRENCSAPVVAESGYIDNVISPSLSRQYLIAAVQTFYDKR